MGDSKDSLSLSRGEPSATSLLRTMLWMGDHYPCTPVQSRPRSYLDSHPELSLLPVCFDRVTCCPHKVTPPTPLSYPGLTRVTRGLTLASHTVKTGASHRHTSRPNFVVFESDVSLLLAQTVYVVVHVLTSGSLGSNGT